MQEELLIVIKLDASSRKAGALKGEAGCRTLNNAADESLRLAAFFVG
jgi:hypothetical protein